MKLGTIADSIGAQLDAGLRDVEINRISSAAGADESSITFLSNPRFLDETLASKAGVVIVKKGMPIEGKICLEVGDSYVGYAFVARLFEDASPAFGSGISDSAVIDKTAKIGSGISVGPKSVIGACCEIGDNTEIAASCVIERGVKIGANCRIDSGAVIRRDVQMGSRVIIQSGAVIGSEGHANAFDRGRWVRIPCFGTVIIEDDVEIGANTTIDRGNFEPTIIRCGARLDNLTHIAHNVEIGAHSAFAAQVGIAGSTKVGHHVMLAGQAGIADHLNIGDGAFVAAQAGVSKDVPAGLKVTGTPARPLMEQRRIDAALSDLPKLRHGIVQNLKETE